MGEGVGVRASFEACLCCSLRLAVASVVEEVGSVEEWQCLGQLQCSMKSLGVGETAAACC